MTKPTVLNTRPLALQSSTDEAFTQHGFNTINFPCIEISQVGNPQSVVKKLTAIKPNDFIIFTSQYAVRHAFKIYPEFSLPHNATVITVGSKTAHVLEQHYTGHIWTPKQQSSEGVIDLLKGFSEHQNIRLISAENGRDVMRSYALKNDIDFQQINVYKRQLPKFDHKTIQLIKKTNPLIILATSETTLNHLKILLKNVRDDLLNQKILCASARIQDKAKSLGFNKSLNMETANPLLMAEKLKSILYS
jgi:uroporphyrinogen-III synthase